MNSDVKNSFWHGASMKWLMGAIFAPIKIVGPQQVKVMTRGMALVFVNSLLGEMRASGAAQIEQGNHDTEVLKGYRKIECESGLIEEESDVDVLPLEENTINVKFAKCPYGKLCNDALSGLFARGDFNKKTTPCLRMETYSASLALINKSKRAYRLVQFAPGAVCECQFAPTRVKR